jgi:biopolymer transport protein ExbD
MTPMIDVTFLLLFFFMVTSHIASIEKVAVELPRPDHNQSSERKPEEKVLINLQYTGENGEPGLMFGSLTLDSTAELSERLHRVAQEQPQAEVILRADRRLAYGHVRRVLAVISSAGLGRVQVVTELGPRT